MHGAYPCIFLLLFLVSAVTGEIVYLVYVGVSLLSDAT